MAAENTGSNTGKTAQTMLEAVYKKRVARDLPSWVANGWVNADKADDLLASVDGASLQNRLPAIVAMLGTVLLACAAMTFVAANWQEIPKAGRLAILFGTLWACYGAAGWSHARGWSIFYQASIVLGCAVFGASIMLIAQMYHINRHYPDGIMVWGIGTLIAAALTRSGATAVLGFGLITLWTGYETFEFDAIIHWPFLVAWVPVSALAVARRWNPAINAAAISLFIWIAFTVEALAETYSWPVQPVFGIWTLVAAAMLCGAIWSEIHHIKMDNQPAYGWSSQGLFVFMGMVFALQVACIEDNVSTNPTEFISSGLSANPWIGLVLAFALISGITTVFATGRNGFTAKESLVFLAAIVGIALSSIIPAPQLIVLTVFALGYFALAIMVIKMGQRRRHTAAINIGFAAFAVETLYIYFETLGTLLDTALFFLTGGIVLVVLAILLERVRRRLVAPKLNPGTEAPA